MLLLCSIIFLTVVRCVKFVSVTSIFICNSCCNLILILNTHLFPISLPVFLSSYIHLLYILFCSFTWANLTPHLLGACLDDIYDSQSLF